MQEEQKRLYIKSYLDGIKCDDSGIEVMQGAFPRHVHKIFEWIRVGKIPIPTIHTKTRTWIYSNLNDVFALEELLLQWYFITVKHIFAPELLSG